MSEERHTCWQCGEECDCMSKPCITCTICDDQDSDERKIEDRYQDDDCSYPNDD